MAGVTAIETRTAGVTVKVVDPLMEPEVAVTLVLPSPTPVAIPEAFTVAMPLLAVVQATEFVRTRVLPSL